MFDACVSKPLIATINPDGIHLQMNHNLFYDDVYEIISSVNKTKINLAKEYDIDVWKVFDISTENIDKNNFIVHIRMDVVDKLLKCQYGVAFIKALPNKIMQEIYNNIHSAIVQREETKIKIVEDLNVEYSDGFVYIKDLNDKSFEDSFKHIEKADSDKSDEDFDSTVRSYDHENPCSNGCMSNPQKRDDE